MDNFEECNKALDRAKIQILTRSVFLSSICFELRHKISEQVPTAATDGLSILYNPKFFLSLSADEQIGLIAHEIWHVAFDHVGRRNQHDPKLWNMAGDYVINALLIKHGFTIPADGLYNPKWCNNHTEEIYEKLKVDDTTKSKDQLAGDIHLPGSLTDNFKGGAIGDIDAAKQKTGQIISKAKTIAEISGKEAGQIPGEIQRHIEEILNPVISWYEYLFRYLFDMVKNDFSWRRPNRRFLPKFYLPSQGTPTISNVTCALDLSGSISKRQLNEIYSEVENIRNTFSPNELTLIGFDHRIIKDDIKIINQHTRIKDTVFSGGGGGTSFNPVIEYCNSHKPTVLIIFTDLYAEHITDEPTYPTIWVCYSNHKPQGIGETIYYSPKTTK